MRIAPPAVKPRSVAASMMLKVADIVRNHNTKKFILEDIAKQLNTIGRKMRSRGVLHNALYKSTTTITIIIITITIIMLNFSVC